jgi:GNAT superfamily N-acetyltransferase
MLHAADYRIQETLSDGTAVTIRATRPDDKQRIVRAFEALEPRTIYLRFFHQKKALSEEELRRLTEMDFVREVALVATIAGEDEEIIIGLGRYAARGPSAEIAFTVEEDYQGRGIASLLLHHLAHIAQRNGIAQLEAQVLAENTAMLAVFRHSGLPMTKQRTDGVVHVKLSLGG